MNYDEMTDAEIDKAVQHVIQGKQLWAPLLEYCNNWSHSGPIIAEYRFTMLPLKNSRDWIVSDGWMMNPRHEHKDENPRRAEMIVFLKMKASDHG